MLFLRNYFFIFFLAYLILFVSKMVFALYLDAFFDTYALTQKLHAVVWGYKFDFAVSAIIALLSTLPDRHKKSTVLLSTLLLVSLFLFQISDIFYFYDASRHVGYEILDTFTDALSLFNTALLQHTGVTLGGVLFAVLLALGLYRVLGRVIRPVAWDRYAVVKKLLLIALSVFFIRGMFNHIPLNPWQSNQIGDGKLASIALNGTYNMIHALSVSSSKLKPLRLPVDTSAAPEELIPELYEGYQPVAAKLERPNVIFFFLESWSWVKISPTITPFLFEMMERSLHPNVMLANGHRTTEGIFATLTSYQNPLGKSVAKTQLQDYTYDSIIDILNKDGYESIFFQGTAKETSGTGSLSQQLGFKTSYGKHDVMQRRYGENAWGVFDQDLYDFVRRRVSGLEKPFVIGINGATTHDDMIPEDAVMEHFSDDEGVNKKLNAYHSADKALREFVTAMEAEHPNTLFVFFADHCGIVNGSAFENYLIPFGVYHRDLTPQHYDVILSQRDIAPTVLDLLYGDYRARMPDGSGKSLLSDTRFFNDYFHNGILGWVEGAHGVEIDISSGVYECFEIQGDGQRPCACGSIHEKLYHRALAFNRISQKLLFEGNVPDFHRYKGE